MLVHVTMKFKCVCVCMICINGLKDICFKVYFDMIAGIVCMYVWFESL